MAVRPDASTDPDKGAKREALLADLRKLKSERESVLAERAKSDQELTQLNASIQKMVRYFTGSRRVRTCKITCLSRV